MPRYPVVRFAFAFVLLLFVAATARANTRCVNPGGTDGCFATIQAAVNASIDFDTIQIAAGTYNEKVNMQPPNNKWLTIQGAGAEKTIVDGTGLGPALAPVFQFATVGNNPLSATLSHMTIRGGYRGVDTGRATRITLSNLVIRDNGPGSGAGVFANSNFVTIINSVIRDNHANDAFFGCDGSGGAGGGIGAFCGGAFYTIINSAIVNNTARFGGGAAFVNGFQTILNSTFSGNQATDPSGIGAAMMSFADRTYISNSTIANNPVRPGGAALALFSSYNELRANLLQDNPGGNCLPVPGVTITSAGYNVIDDGTCAATGPGDLENTSAVLGPLQNNGGPTPTHALEPGPGVDHLAASICPAPATDQRGVERAQGAACDAGAFEAVPLTAEELLETLLDLVDDVEPSYGLRAFARMAQVALQADRPEDACAALGLLQAQVDRKADKPGSVKLSAAEAAAITEANAAVRAALGCS